MSVADRVNNPAEKLIEQAQPLVRSLAAKIRRNLPVGVDLDDLIAYGQVGLAEAARDFDARLGVQFTTFAYYRVRGAIFDGVSKMSWTSRARLRRLRYEQMAHQALSADTHTELDPATSLDDQAAWFGSMVEKLAVVYIATHGDKRGGIRESAIVDPAADRPSKIVAQREVAQELRARVNQLAPIERRLIQLTYFDGMTLQDTADRLGISKSWASRLHAKTLEKLARALRRAGAD